MPELPEVETVVRDLRPELCGQRFTSVFAGRRKLRHPWKPSWGRCVTGRPISNVRRRGKWIVVDFESSGHLLIHLGMTGQLTVRQTQEVREEHTHLVFTLHGDRRQLRFRDVRRFGSICYVADQADLSRRLDSRLGPEPWDIVTASWHDGWRNSHRCLKAILLDQRVLAGVGNIYADESLFAARLPPTLHGRRTTLAQAERLRHAIIEVLERAIAARGTSISDYVGGSGLRGGFQDHLQVYGRVGLPCLVCRRGIVGMRLAGRSTHWCPNCQRADAALPRRRLRRPAPAR